MTVTDRTVNPTEVIDQLGVAARDASVVLRYQAGAVQVARADAAWWKGQADEHLRRKREAQRVVAEMAGKVRQVRAAVEAWQLGALSAEDALQEINDLVEKP